jgi:hypothetical protein
MTVSHSVNAGRHALEERGNDLYETPQVATEAVLRAERHLPRTIWEPAAGRGAIVRVLRAHGHKVFTSDIIGYGFSLDFVADFLEQKKAPPGCDCILTNPPFKIIGQFIEHALGLCPKVVMLARLSFLESERRSDLLERRGLARVHVFRNRLPMLHRDGWTGPRASSATAFAWYSWDRNHRGPTTIDRISWIPIPSTGGKPPSAITPRTERTLSK